MKEGIGRRLLTITEKVLPLIKSCSLDQPSGTRQASL